MTGGRVNNMSCGKQRPRDRCLAGTRLLFFLCPKCLFVIMLNCFAHGYYAQKMVNNGYFCTCHLAIDLKRDEQPLIVPKVLNVMTNNYYATDIQI